jgi:hypothetical protein
MNMVYQPDLKAHLSFDEHKKVRYIHHTQEYWLSDYNSPRKAAIDYLQRIAHVFKIPTAQLNHLSQKVSFLEPRDEGLDYRLSEEKQLFDSTTYGFYQTYLNVPIWQAGLSVTVKQNPSRVVYSANNNQEGVNAKLPDADAIERYKQMFRQAEASKYSANIKGEGEQEESETASFIRHILGTTEQISESLSEETAATQQTEPPKINRGRFFVYKYDERNRQIGHPRNNPDNIGSNVSGVIEKDDVHPTLPLPPVPDNIQDGQYYLVAELVFSLTTPEWGRLNWRVLVEVETNAILYLRALIDGVNGLVFTYDPITSTGVLTNTADQSNAALNPLRDDVVLSNLEPPVAGTQPLVGTYVQVIDDDSPAVMPPTQPTGNDFDYEVRTNNFAAVNAYYHADQLFALIEDLGFPIASYFDGTSFPIHVDHRASTSSSPGASGIEINAFCQGDGEGNGIGLVGYCLGDTGDTTNPIGRATDKWVHWHEIGGHGILWDHVDSPNFGFAHSAGDGLAALQNDPESLLRGLPERFRYAPFRAGLDRWFNRDVTTGWAWGGSQDSGGYNSEQILATTHFRIYRSLGGDAADVARRWFASRVVTYLILRAVGTLTPATNPNNALGFCNALMAVDLLDWTSEGLAGGAYNKVIRWAFEKQGLFQPPGAPTPVVSVGAPPAVDVYINDGRNGEYEYKHDHWNNTSVWNRNMADGGTGHQPAIMGVTNYAYVTIKNRGTTAASNVVVKGYHCLPGAGLTWPTDFVQMTPLSGIVIASIGANNTEEVTVGPFEWIPNTNVYGHDCLLMIASTDGDPSNIDNFTAGETIEEWRLVPHDNNVGQRNVQLVPGGGGTEGLIRGLHEHVFVAGNTFRRRATMELKVQLPKILSANGWQLTFKNIDGNRFVLKPGEKRRIVIDLVPGKTFTKEQVQQTNDRDIAITLYANDMLLGGMTYRLDPDLKAPMNQPPDDKAKCNDKANDLLKCLNLDGGKVTKVCVKKVSLDIALDNDCKCD